MYQERKRGAFASSAGIIGTHVLNINPQVNLAPKKDDLDLWIEKKAVEIHEAFDDLYKTYGMKLKAKIPKNRADMETIRDAAARELPGVLSINLIQDEKTKDFFFTKETIIEEGATIYQMDIETNFNDMAKELWLDFLSVVTKSLHFVPVYKTPSFEMLHEMYLEEDKSNRKEITLHETFQYYYGEMNEKDDAQDCANGEGAKIIEAFLKRKANNFEKNLNHFKPKGDDEIELKKNLLKWYPIIIGFDTDLLITMENHPYITPEENTFLEDGSYRMPIWDNFIIVAGGDEALTESLIETLDADYNSGVLLDPIIDVKIIKRKGNEPQDNKVQQFFETIDEIITYSQKH